MLLVEIALNLSFPKNVLSFMRQSVTFPRSYLNQGYIILGWIVYWTLKGYVCIRHVVLFIWCLYICIYFMSFKEGHMVE